MLNRRHLRVKVLQCLYAFFQSGNTSLPSGEKEIIAGIDKIHDLYLHQLSLIIETGHLARQIIEDNRNKRITKKEDHDPNIRFVSNRCLTLLSENPQLEKKLKNNKISWANSPEVVKNIFNHFKTGSHYQTYMSLEQSSFEQDRDLIVALLKYYICENELLHHYYEDKSIYWLDDWELINKMIIKGLKAMNGEAELGGFEVMPLYKDIEDKEFALELFRRTILNEKEFASLIASKTQNWDIDRIALMDIIIMKMALTEILKFSNIPIKVSLNEYIELSKMYSTPKSNVFVNGVLDKLVEELVSKNIINKLAKGLV